MKIRELKSTAEVIDAIGRDRFMALTGKSTQQTTNYKSTGRFPPETFVVLQDEIERLRCRAPRSLWGMIEPPKLKRAS